MPSQSGKIVLVLVFTLFVLGVIGYSYIGNLNISNTPDQLADSRKEILKTSDTEAAPSRCSKDFDDDVDNDEGVWEYLPDGIKEETYKKGKVSAGESTYQIYLLKRSEDCRYIAFMIELEARGAGAYDKEDYKDRGVYIFDSKTNKVINVMIIPEDSFLNRKEYGSNSWSNDNKYKFVLSEDTKQGEFLGRRYLYDVKSGMLTDSVTEL